MPGDAESAVPHFWVGVHNSLPDAECFKTVLWIRIRSDPKLLEGSGYGSGKIIPDPDPGRAGSEMNFEVKLRYPGKLIKFDNLSTKMQISKYKFLFIKNMQPNTHTRQKYKGKIYVKNIRKN
jgi:hypothetical protein